MLQHQTVQATEIAWEGLSYSATVLVLGALLRKAPWATDTTMNTDFELSNYQVPAHVHDVTSAMQHKVLHKIIT